MAGPAPFWGYVFIEAYDSQGPRMTCTLQGRILMAPAQATVSLGQMTGVYRSNMNNSWPLYDL